MASTALVKDLLWRASVLLGDTAPQFQRFSEREMVHALNAGQVIIVTFAPFIGARMDALRQAQGTRQSIEAIPAAFCKPADGSTPSLPIYGTQILNIVRLMGADGLTPGRSLQMVKRSVLDDIDPLWHTVTGEPEVWVYDERLPMWYWLYPGVTGTMWAEVGYAAQPLAIPNTATVDADGKHTSGVYAQTQTSTQTITIRDECLEPLIDYVVALCSSRDSKFADPAKARYHGERFVAWLNAKVKALTGNDPEIAELPVPAGGAAEGA